MGYFIPVPRPNIAGKQHILGFVMRLPEGNHHSVWERWRNKVLCDKQIQLGNKQRICIMHVQESRKCIHQALSQNQGLLRQAKFKVWSEKINHWMEILYSPIYNLGSQSNETHNEQNLARAQPVQALPDFPVKHSSRWFTGWHTAFGTGPKGYTCLPVSMVGSCRQVNTRSHQVHQITWKHQSSAFYSQLTGF